MEELLKRSFQLEIEIARLFDLPSLDDSPRARMAKVMCSIVIEHASSAKVLISAGHKTSAISLFRLQYEALVRAIWIYHAASQPKIDALCEPMNAVNFKRLNNQQRSIDEMFKDLDGNLPDHVMQGLKEFKESAWKPLCSMVHGGVYALQTHAAEFPDSLLEGIIKLSNGISCLTSNLLTIISSDNSLVGFTTQLYRSYHDCLPIQEAA